MTREEYIESIVSQIDDKAAREEFGHELEAHIDDRIAFYTDAGYDYDYALDKAIGRMGDTEAVGMQMNSLYDITTVNICTWVFTALFCVILAAFMYEKYMGIMPATIPIELTQFLFHGAICFLAIVFLLATKHKNYVALKVVSIADILFCTAYPALNEVNLSINNLAHPLFSVGRVLSKAETVTFNSVMVFVFAALVALEIVYLAVSGVIGVLYAAQIKLVIKGYAKTKILKRFTHTRFLSTAAIISEITLFLMVIIEAILSIKG